MKNRFKNKINKGFTIIEVIIVLVIAAVIMLAVFLVVPQLQRTQRNNRTQADARRVLAAGESFASTNAGVYPACTAGAYNATYCPGLHPITGDVLAPSGTAYTVTITVGAVTAVGTMLISKDGACATPSTTPAAGSRFIVAVAQEAVGTNTTFCVSS